MGLKGRIGSEDKLHFNSTAELFLQWVKAQIIFFLELRNGKLIPSVLSQSWNALFYFLKYASPYSVSVKH